MSIDPHDQESSRKGGRKGVRALFSWALRKKGSDPFTRKKGSDPFTQDVEGVRSAWSGLEQTDPPDLLDQAVLNTARRELGGPGKRRHWRWMSGFATAAVVVMALAIVIQQDEQPLAPGLEKADGFRLDQAEPVLRKKESDRDEPEEKARRNAADARLGADSNGRAETRLRPGAPDAPVAASPAKSVNSAVASSVAENLADAPADLEEESSTVPEADEWIERLLHLHETGQSEELIAELAAFHDAYPGYPLPPELE